MNLLLDTRLLLWAASAPERLSARARGLLLAADSHLIFSSASWWEIGMKRTLGRADFNVDPRRLRRKLALVSPSRSTTSPAPRCSISRRHRCFRVAS